MANEITALRAKNAALESKVGAQAEVISAKDQQIEAERAAKEEWKRAAGERKTANEADARIDASWEKTVLEKDRQLAEKDRRIQSLERQRWYVGLFSFGGGVFTGYKIAPRLPGIIAFPGQ